MCERKNESAATIAQWLENMRARYADAVGTDSEVLAHVSDELLAYDAMLGGLRLALNRPDAAGADLVAMVQVGMDLRTTAKAREYSEAMSLLAGVGTIGDGLVVRVRKLMDRQHELTAEVAKADAAKELVRGNLKAELEETRKLLVAERKLNAVLNGPRGEIVREVLEERARQDAKWGNASDDTQTEGQLVKGGCAYALRQWFSAMELWPFAKPPKHYALPERGIVVGMAMFLAELERRQRAAAKRSNTEDTEGTEDGAWQAAAGTRLASIGADGSEAWEDTSGCGEPVGEKVAPAWVSQMLIAARGAEHAVSLASRCDVVALAEFIYTIVGAASDLLAEADAQVALNAGTFNRLADAERNALVAEHNALVEERKELADRQTSLELMAAYVIGSVWGNTTGPQATSLSRVVREAIDHVADFVDRLQAQVGGEESVSPRSTSLDAKLQRLSATLAQAELAKKPEAQAAPGIPYNDLRAAVDELLEAAGWIPESNEELHFLHAIHAAAAQIRALRDANPAPDAAIAEAYTKGMLCAKEGGGMDECPYDFNTARNLNVAWCDGFEACEARLKPLTATAAAAQLARPQEGLNADKVLLSLMRASKHSAATIAVMARQAEMERALSNQ